MRNAFLFCLIAILVSCCQKNPDANDGNENVTQGNQEITDTLKEKLVSPKIFDDITLANESFKKGEITQEQNKSKLVLYLEEKPTESQIDILKKLGVNCFTELWTPPSTNHELGFFVAEIPNDKLVEILHLNFIKKVDTAERETKPDITNQNDVKPDIQTDEPQSISVLGVGTAIVSMKLLSYTQSGTVYTCKVKILKNKGTGPATPTLSEGSEVTVTINENTFTTKNSKESVLNIGNTIEANIQHEPVKEGGKSSNIWNLVKYN
ncbi:MAG: hypothetical protein JXA68_01735 [Ignavibacteriales bacterium]|nr:hypothetical protein [Ignavibacteriales bacterium]